MTGSPFKTNESRELNSFAEPTFLWSRVCQNRLYRVQPFSFVGFFLPLINTSCLLPFLVQKVLKFSDTKKRNNQTIRRALVAANLRAKVSSKRVSHCVIGEKLFDNSFNPIEDREYLRSGVNANSFVGVKSHCSNLSFRSNKSRGWDRPPRSSFWILVMRKGHKSFVFPMI